jgi:hypothetical protein
MKTQSTISFFIITLLLFAGAVSMAAFSEPSSSAPGGNATNALDVSTTTQTTLNTLGMTELLSGSTGYVSVDSVGRIGVNKTTPDSDVRVSVNGSIRADTLVGSGTSRICTGTYNTLTGYVFITRC